MDKTSGAFHQYNAPEWMWLALAGVLVVYALIEIVHTKKDHKIGMKEAVHWSIFYVALGLAFGVPIYMILGGQAAGEYYAAYFIEKALSLDNLFVIGLIFISFNVDPALERRMLNYGIAGAIIFRAIFIMGGLELLKHFHWASVIFGLILLNGARKAYKEARGSDCDNIEEEVKVTDGRVWRAIERYLPVHREFDGHKLITKVNGKTMFTLMAAVILLVEITDVMFAFDSVPAVLAVSPDRFVAYSSNLFAILGLRALFFVYQALADKFWALSWGLAGVLSWIAFKLIAAPFGLHISIPLSLTVLAVFLGGSVLLSILQPRTVPLPDIDIDADGKPGVTVEKQAELV